MVTMLKAFHISIHGTCVVMIHKELSTFEVSCLSIKESVPEDSTHSPTGRMPSKIFIFVVEEITKNFSFLEWEVSIWGLISSFKFE